MKIQKAQKTAILFGATGLVGGYCLEFLLESPLYSKVKAFNRRKLNIKHPKYEEYIIDFDKLDDYADWIVGDDVFCCLGTTRKKAGSKAAFSKVDYTYVFDTAKIAAKNSANQFLLVSTVGADKDSMFFYNQIKGEIESAVQNLNYWSIHIFRPSLLLGSRNELRIGEKLATYASGILNLVTNRLAPKYSAVHGEQVAKAMVLVAQRIDGGTFIYESDEIQQF
ncbi:MAG: oxidoreductase [Saprospiraceae bacterium]